MLTNRIVISNCDGDTLKHCSQSVVKEVHILEIDKQAIIGAVVAQSHIGLGAFDNARKIASHLY